MNAKTLQKYAKLIVSIGVNLQKGDDLVISTTFYGLELAKEIAMQAYKGGAKKVDFIFSDEKVNKIKYMNESLEDLVDIPLWEIQQKNSIVERKACYVAILSEDPNAYTDINANTMASISRARHKAFKNYYEAATSNKIRWCLCAVPCDAWAQTVFPNLPKKQAINKLWELILQCMRLDQKDSLKAWQNHIDRLQKLSDFMTQSQFKSLYYNNSIGTNLLIDLPKGYYFSGGHEKSQDGIGFTANMPTEEIFSLPDRNSANGKIVSSMPLIHNGSIVEDFELTLKNGRIVDFKAKKGYDVLESLINTDEGSHYLGEVALVQYDSPIQKLKTLFYNTLFDENASCHFAIGEAYPMISDVQDMSDEQKNSLGINKSCTHVDFMIGTSDLKIQGIKQDGQKVVIFENGNFAI